MTTVAEIVRAAVPSADADYVDFIMWARTPYPCGKVTPRDIYKAASGHRRAFEHGLRLCDHCDHLAMPDQWECAECAAILREAATP